MLRTQHILWLVSCFVLKISAAPVSGDGEKLCGATFANALSLVCVEFHSPFPQSSEGAQSVKNLRGSVTNECCLLGCTEEKLRSFCKVARNLTEEQKTQKPDSIDKVTKVYTPTVTKPAAPPKNTVEVNETVDPRETESKDSVYDDPEPEIFYIATDNGPWTAPRSWSDSIYYTRTN